MKFEFVYGMIRGFYTPRSYSRTAEAEESGNRLKAHGINCVALVVNQYQETFHSTRIFASNVRTQDDDELALQIRRLHDVGMRVMLKPMVDPPGGVWRGNIRQFRNMKIFADVSSDTVTPRVRSGLEFICRYAEPTGKTHCENSRLDTGASRLCILQNSTASSFAESTSFSGGPTAFKSALRLTMTALIYRAGSFRENSAPSSKTRGKCLNSGSIWGIPAALSYQILFPVREQMKEYRKSGMVLWWVVRGMIIFLDVFTFCFRDHFSRWPAVMLSQISAGDLFGPDGLGKRFI